MVEHAPRSERPRTVLESALRYDRAATVVLLVLLPVVSWMWIVVMALDMDGPMTGASAWMMTMNWDAAHLLLIAGIYQFTPIKQACLRKCQSPLGFLMSRWRGGSTGAFRLGLEHGAYCVGCCWALMLLLFTGGVMNLAVIAALTALVAFEKLTPFGLAGARISGALLMAAGFWMLVQ